MEKNKKINKIKISLTIIFISLILIKLNLKYLQENIGQIYPIIIFLTILFISIIIFFSSRKEIKKMFIAIKKIKFFLVLTLLILIIIQFEHIYRLKETSSNSSLYVNTNNKILAYAHKENYESGTKILINKTFIYDQESKDYIKINSKGLRDFDYSYTKPNNTYRIVILGDSVTYGWPGKMMDSWPKQLESLLNNNSNNSSKKFEVINMGTSGYDILQEVELLKTKGLKYNPDVIIFGYTMNDPISFFMIQRMFPRNTIIEREKEILNKINAPFYCHIRNTIFNSAIGSRLNYNFFRVFYNQYLFIYPKSETMKDVRLIENNPNFYFTIHTDKCSWNRISFAFKEIKELSYNKTVIITIFPVNFIGYDWEEYPIRDIHQKLIEESERNDFLTIDLLDFLKKYSQEELRTDFPMDSLHYNKKGNNIFARIVYTQLFDEQIIIT